MNLSWNSRPGCGMPRESCRCTHVGLNNGQNIWLLQDLLEALGECEREPEDAPCAALTFPVQSRQRKSLSRLVSRIWSVQDSEINAPQDSENTQIGLPYLGSCAI